MMWSEARLCRQRINSTLVQEAMLIQSAITTVMGGKEAAKNFNRLTNRIVASD